MAADARLPPSPALSDCDSLAGIDDLDAFLAAQGPLSLFPTPRASNTRGSAINKPETRIVQDPLTPPCEFTRASSTRPAAIAVRYAGAFLEVLHPDELHLPVRPIDTFKELFRKLRLPAEVIAMAYMILCAHAYSPSTQTPLCPNADELSLLSCLILADTYTNDAPFSLQTWASAMQTSAISVAQLQTSTTAMLCNLDWRLHPFSDLAAIELSMALLSEVDIASKSCDKSAIVTCRLDTTINHDTRWVHGQLTPCESPEAAYMIDLEGLSIGLPASKHSVMAEQDNSVAEHFHPKVSSYVTQTHHYTRVIQDERPTLHWSPKKLSCC